MACDEISVTVVDRAGNEMGRYPVTHPARLRAGQELWLALDGRERLFRVLGERTGHRGERVVPVIEVHLRCPFCAGPLLAARGRAALEEDEDGDFVRCPGCSRRVAIERIPTDPPGGPAKLRVAPDQEGEGAAP
ncbi:MAG TPA: hypothetical protein VFL83_19565 [Anaeromyxobacter sp.]|nr:hypothetical protein [Anaeromyxobacter sp.]